MKELTLRHPTDDTFDHSNSYSHREDDSITDGVVGDTVLDCSHVHVKEVSSGVFVCTACRRKIEDADRIERERQWKTHIDKVEDMMGPSCTSAVDRGISAAWLMDFTQANNLWDVPTWKVCRDYIVPATLTTRCRFVDLADMQASRSIGRASTYVCHCWGAPFGLIAAALQDDGLEDAYVWIDLFAVRQWPCSRPDMDIETVVTQCSTFMVVCPYVLDVTTMSPEQKINWNFTGIPTAALDTAPFLRAWCLLEMAIAGRTPDLAWRVKVGAVNKSMWSAEYRAEMLSALFYMVDANKAAATYDAERDWLRNKLVRDFGAADAINSSVRRRVLDSINHTGDCCRALKLADQGHTHALSAVLAEKSASLKSKYWLEAARCGYTKVLRRMVDGGFTHDLGVDCEDPGGVTALMQTAFAGHDTTCAFLLSLGCNVDAVDSRGRTAAFIAATEGQASCLQLLIAHGCKLDTKAFFGRTACFMAAMMSHSDCLSILIKRKCDVNAVADDGRTPLMMAAMSGSEACVQLLIDAGGDLKRLDNDGCDAMHLAREFPACERLLAKAARKAVLANMFYM